MDRQALEKHRIEIPIPFEHHTEEDAYGYYSTGAFELGDIKILISHDCGSWHLSASHRSRLPTYEEMKDIRYKFLPDGINAAEIFPPRNEFVNLHPYCRHLYEIKQKVADYG